MLSPLRKCGIWRAKRIGSRIATCVLSLKLSRHVSSIREVSGARLLPRQLGELMVSSLFAQLRARVPYFRGPASMRRISIRSTRDRKTSCAALTTIQFMPNADVLTCFGMPPVGNIKDQAIRPIWESRPRWWESGCILERPCCEHEKQTLTFADRS